MATATLSEEDVRFINELRAAEVLNAVDPQRLDEKNGVIFLTCADGDYFDDIFQHRRGIQAVHRANPRMHTFSWHGGALACAPGSPVNKYRNADEIFRSQVPDAVKMKDIKVVALHIHAPCGAAGMAGMSLQKCFEFLFRAKKTIKFENRGIHVACFFFVAYPDGTRAVFSCRRVRWEEWLRENRSQTALVGL